MGATLSTGDPWAADFSPGLATVPLVLMSGFRGRVLVVAYPVRRAGRVGVTTDKVCENDSVDRWVGYVWRYGGTCAPRYSRVQVLSHVEEEGRWQGCHGRDVMSHKHQRTSL